MKICRNCSSIEFERVDAPDYDEAKPIKHVDFCDVCQARLRRRETPATQTKLGGI
jgi:hypothetical protein